MASQITSLTVVYSAAYWGADQRKYQSSASLAFVRGIHRWPVNSPHKWPVTRKMFLFDDVIMHTPYPLALNIPNWQIEVNLKNALIKSIKLIDIFRSLSKGTCLLIRQICYMICSWMLNNLISIIKAYCHNDLASLVGNLCPICC